MKGKRVVKKALLVYTLLSYYPRQIEEQRGRG